jgi:exodeoxyribonuclease V alpha subunit
MPPEVSLLDGVLERVTFANPETGYTIARIGPAHGGSDLVTVVGALLGAQVGESLRLRGRWTSHPKFGRQFEVHSYTTVLPATTQGIQRYLGSGLIKGIGPVMAERMVAHFGVDIMHVIENSPGRLIEVEGLGPKRTAMITAAWAEQKAIKEVMVFLQGVGVSTSLAVRIYKKYRDDAISVVRDEPYRLAADEQVDYGFDELDELAHAYAVTIHRSQGSEYPAVVIPLTMGSWMMLQRNLLYTGVTRAKKLVVLAGSRRALGVAVRSKGSGRRHTALAHRLRA